MSSADIQAEAKRRWEDGSFVQKQVPIPSAVYEEILWVPYEMYMRAQLVDCQEGRLGKLIVDFPVHGSEGNELHIHPLSDRVITVIRGSGEFVAKRPNGNIERFSLEPGDCVWMPRGTLHTFFAGEQGLLVESFHNPFIPLEDEQALIYPRGSKL